MRIPFRIGNTDVYLLKLEGERIRLRLPLPPSTNRRQTIGWHRVRSVGRVGVSVFPQAEKRPVLMLTKEAREYLEECGLALKWIVSTLRHVPIAKSTPFMLWWHPANPRYDNHNGLKLLCDALEAGGIVADDRFILPVTISCQAVSNDDPHVIVEFSKVSAPPV